MFDSQAGSRGEAERWITIRYEEKCIPHHSVVPSHRALDEIKQGARVSTGERNGEPCDNHYDEHGNVQEKKHDVMRNGEKPLHRRKPAIQVARSVWVVDIEVHRLVIVGGRKTLL